MALVDLRHFVSPFKDRLTLVIIIAVSLAFALYRFSTSQAVKPTFQPKSASSEDFLKDIEKLLGP